MTQIPYDNGDRWDVLVICDGCKAQRWDPMEDDPVTWSLQVGSCDGPDYCPKCAIGREVTQR